MKKRKSNMYKESFPFFGNRVKDEIGSVIFESYSLNKIICISYFENGIINSYSGVIEKIDLINDNLYLLPKKKFLINRIKEVSIK